MIIILLSGNNLVENVIRRVILGRENYLFAEAMKQHSVRR